MRGGGFSKSRQVFVRIDWKKHIYSFFFVLLKNHQIDRDFTVKKNRVGKSSNGRKIRNTEFFRKFKRKGKRWNVVTFSSSDCPYLGLSLRRMEYFPNGPPQSIVPDAKWTTVIQINSIRTFISSYFIGSLKLILQGKKFSMPRVDITSFSTLPLSC